MNREIHEGGQNGTQGTDLRLYYVRPMVEFKGGLCNRILAFLYSCAGLLPTAKEREECVACTCDGGISTLR